MADYNYFDSDLKPVHGGGCGCMQSGGAKKSNKCKNPNCKCKDCKCENCDCKYCNDNCKCNEKKSNKLSKVGGTKAKNIDNKKSKKMSGTARVVHVTNKGKKFVYRYSKETGKRYKVYIDDLRRTKKNKPSKKSKKVSKKTSKKSSKKSSKKGRR